MITETRTNTMKRIAGRNVQVEAQFDGVQRAEWFSDGNGVSFGRLHTGRHSDFVYGYRADGTPHGFDKKAFGNSKNKAIVAARKWIVEGNVA